MEEYKKSCEDELDWVIINQLHEATLQMSKSCFEFKKICVGLIGATLAVLAKLTDGKLDHSYFYITFILCFGFWIADFSAYYFQRKTRIAMNKKLLALATRNSIENYPSENLDVTWRKAAFNHSMVLYYAFAFIEVVGWLFYVHFGK
ncbi:hypothetical protein [Rahnella variigena]|uniref:Uncharacterized protein n=1 Tax=Rahnella variigena TaxID=574964 RepID=A0ABX9PYB2_9GAMM|nr:hypothetical protein [Rahnella variigena]RJT50761.1 hypothetical protein D6D38_19765 [Rahnella variigena]RKF69259.1 hypothetical protein CKQ54_13190 [Rahnella variigena]